MKKILIKTAGLAILATTLTGCVGSNAVTGKLMKFNVEVVDNRYARAGVNLLLAPVYGITTAVDYLVLNSLEFWTGKNPMTGAPHIFDSKVDTMYKVNDDLDPSLQSAPVDPITMQKAIKSGEMKQIDDNTIQMDITYNNGDEAVLRGIRDGDNVSYYIDGQLVSKTTIAQLEALKQS